MKDGSKFPIWTLVSCGMTLASIGVSFMARKEGTEATREIVRDEINKMNETTNINNVNE